MKFMRCYLKNEWSIYKYRKNNWGKINNKLLSDNKKDTIFILGSGSSINDITESQWLDIKKADTIGFNFWPIHEHVPTYYSFEVPRDNVRKDILFKILNQRKKDYAQTIIILKDYIDVSRNDIYKILDIFEKVYLLNDVNIAPPKRKLVERAIKYGVYFKKFFKRYNEVPIIFKMRASVSFNIMLAYELGYKNIVLCGIDLNNTKYFYEDEKYRLSGLPIPPTGQEGHIHKTNDIRYGEVTITDAIVGINEQILKPQNVHLYIGSKKSALYPYLNYYWDNQKSKD